MKTTRTKFRAIALVLAMATVFLSVSFTVVAEDSTVINQNEIITDITEEVSFGNSDEFIPAVYEVEDLREENVKHFSLPDGTYQAVSYGGAVHRQNADGTWRDIDNRLFDSRNEYTTEDGRISFARSTLSLNGEALLYTLTEDNYMIAMGIVGTSSFGDITADDNAVLISSAAVTNHAPKPEILATDSAEEQLSKLRNIDNTTEIVYEDILSGTDIEYVLTGNDIKENIIVKSKRDSYTYTFVMIVKGLTAAENGDGSITLSDETSGEAVYYIPAPYMYDAAGEISYAVSYTLEEDEQNVYTLAVTADETWINADDRAFPVVIDPFIASTAKAKDTVISSMQPTSNFGSLSRLPINHNITALVQINVPSLPYGATYDNRATLCLSHYFTTDYDGFVDVNVYEMTGAWSESTATYNNTSSLIGSNCISTYRLEWVPEYSSESPGIVPLNIADTVYGWYYETPKDWQQSYGFAVEYDSTSTISLLTFKSSECGDSNLTPFISVSYKTAIQDGVYSIENIYYDNRYISGDGYTSGTTVTPAYYGTEPSSSASPNRSALFKISRDSEGNYIIRSMRNNALGLSISRNSLSLRSIPTNDADVDVWDKFQIMWSSTDYDAVVIHPNESTNVINMSSSTSFNQVDEGDGLASSKWRLTRYSGAALNGVEMSRFDSSLILGETFDYDAHMYSSSIGVNGPVTYSTRDTDYTPTYEASINDSTGVLTTRASGEFRVGVTYSGAPYVWYWNINIIFYGCRDYVPIESESSWLYNEVNCQGYALDYTPQIGGASNPLLADNWLEITNSEWNSIEDSNDLLYIFKREFQVWMSNHIGHDNWVEVTDMGGINASLESNQWLIVMRVGYHPEYYDPVSFPYDFDYHFWYRTSTGEWANKHGFGSASEPLGDDLPTDNGSAGWYCGQDKPYYYDSDLIYYRITE